MEETTGLEWTSARTSSNVSEIGYDPTEMKLGVRFQNGSEYHYSNVPPGVVAQFRSAYSPGSFLYKNIRNVYTSERIK